MKTQTPLPTLSAAESQPAAAPRAPDASPKSAAYRALVEAFKAYAVPTQANFAALIAFCDAAYQVLHPVTDSEKMRGLKLDGGFLSLDILPDAGLQLLPTAEGSKNSQLSLRLGDGFIKGKTLSLHVGAGLAIADGHINVKTATGSGIKADLSGFDLAPPLFIDSAAQLTLNLGAGLREVDGKVALKLSPGSGLTCEGGVLQLKHDPYLMIENGVLKVDMDQF